MTLYLYGVEFPVSSQREEPSGDRVVCCGFKCTAAGDHCRAMLPDKITGASGEWPVKTIDDHYFTFA